MIDITQYVDVDEKVRITFLDGMYVEGHIESVEDEEESELGELGLSFWSDDGRIWESDRAKLIRLRF